MPELKTAFISREQSKSNYDWADLSIRGEIIGKARCLINNHEFTIFSINIYPEYQGKGYGKKFIELIKPQFRKITADRVRYSAIGFWENIGFVRDGASGNWTYR